VLTFLFSPIVLVFQREKLKPFIKGGFPSRHCAVLSRLGGWARFVFAAPAFLFSRRLPLAHYPGMRENSRRDVITKHSVFICFAATFGNFLPAFVFEKFDVIFVFVADDVIISDCAVD